MSTWDVDRDELDKLYSPSRWSSRLPPDRVVDDYCESTLAVTASARETLTCELGIEYLDSGGPLLDIYHPQHHTGPLSDAIFVYYHGGYWQALGVEYAGVAAPSLTKYGCTVVAVGYTLAPKANMTTIVKQCRKSVAFLRARFPEKRIFVGGHSAGAHLSACLMSTDWRQYGLETCPLYGAVLLSGVFDLRPVQKMYCNDVLHLTEEEVKEYSPQLVETEKMKLLLPPGFHCLVAWGGEDSPEFKRQSREFIQVLVDQGFPCTILCITESDHFEYGYKLHKEDLLLTQMIIKLMTKTN